MRRGVIDCGDLHIDNHIAEVLIGVAIGTVGAKYLYDKLFNDNKIKFFHEISKKIFRFLVEIFLFNKFNKQLI